MLALAGDVAGRRILDVGCGSGPLSDALRDRGAVVTGIDASAGMPALARWRLGDDVALHVVDLSDRLPFADGEFDDVVASLVLHYLEDWGPTLAELRRVLRPGGRLIASVDHPFVAYTIQDPRPDYFATTSYTFDWTFNGQSVPMRFWRRPLHAMTDALTTAGFRLAVISEPQPAPAARELFPDDLQDLCRPARDARPRPRGRRRRPRLLEGPGRGVPRNPPSKVLGSQNRERPGRPSEVCAVAAKHAIQEIFSAEDKHHATRAVAAFAKQYGA